MNLCARHPVSSLYLYLKATLVLLSSSFLLSWQVLSEWYCQERRSTTFGGATPLTPGIFSCYCSHGLDFLHPLHVRKSSYAIDKKLYTQPSVWNGGSGVIPLQCDI